MGFDRSLGVDRARRLVSTLAGPVRRDRQLVEPDQQEGEGFHQEFRMSFLKSHPGEAEPLASALHGSYINSAALPLLS